MDSLRSPSPPSATFDEIVRALRTLRTGPDVIVEETPAPRRIAARAVAFAADVCPDPAGDSTAGGRFVLLSDDSAPPEWDGTLRVVTYARARVEPEMGRDVLLGEAAWSYLTDALERQAPQHRLLGGTVTSVVDSGFGALADRPETVDVEIRASWSPTGEAGTGSFQAWLETIRALAGLPPLAADVPRLPHR